MLQFWYGEGRTSRLQQATMIMSAVIPGLVFMYLAVWKSQLLVRGRSTYLIIMRWIHFLVFFLYPAVYRQYFFVSQGLTPTTGGLVSHILRLVRATRGTSIPGFGPCLTVYCLSACHSAAPSISMVNTGAPGSACRKPVEPSPPHPPRHCVRLFPVHG